MKTVFLHGLGQTARDWQAVIHEAPFSDADCPALFSLAEGELTYSNILTGLEKRYAATAGPLAFCGLSLGAILALEYTIRHKDQVALLILIGPQYKAPRLLVDFQNLILLCTPEKAFEPVGISKNNMIRLSHSMRSLDFRPRLSEVRCPITIVCGERDAANRKASKRLKELMPQAELHIVPCAGHELNKHAPEAIAGILKRTICGKQDGNIK